MKKLQKKFRPYLIEVQTKKEERMLLESLTECQGFCMEDDRAEDAALLNRMIAELED